jgi:nucleoside-diphosphate-sugar epimerase
MDVLDESSVMAATRGIDVAYYLVHGMRDHADYWIAEAEAARTFAKCAESNGVGRIVYLGGVVPASSGSTHLASRQRTGEFLRSGAVEVVELRAGMILGGGSESWRIVRDLAVRLPFMLLPRWLDSRSRPVGIDDVVDALVAASTVEFGEPVYGLPGPELLSGRQIIERTAALLGIAPRTLRVPIVTPALSSYWIRLITRANGNISRELVEGLRVDLIGSEPDFWPLMGRSTLTSFDRAALQALREEEETVSEGAKHAERLLHSCLPRWLRTTGHG